MGRQVAQELCASLTQGPDGDQGLTINLNHAVVALETESDKVTQVVAYDLLVRKYRKFRAKYVILAAGTIESAKIAQMSKLRDPNGLVVARDSVACFA